MKWLKRQNCKKVNLLCRKKRYKLLRWRKSLLENDIADVFFMISTFLQFYLFTFIKISPRRKEVQYLKLSDKHNLVHGDELHYLQNKECSDIPEIHILQTN